MLRLVFILCLLFTAPTVQGQEAPVVEAGRRAQVESARAAPEFDVTRNELDVLRTLAGVGVQLTPAETLELARQALWRGLSIEAEVALASLDANSDPLLAEPANARMWTMARTEAAKDRQGVLERDVAFISAGRSFRADAAVPVAESFLSMGEHLRAIEILRTALASEHLSGNLRASARLSLCRALLAAGRATEARWELENFPAAPPVYDVLVQAWLTVAVDAEQAAATSDPSSPPPP